MHTEYHHLACCFPINAVKPASFNSVHLLLKGHRSLEVYRMAKAQIREALDEG